MIRTRLVGALLLAPIAAAHAASFQVIGGVAGVVDAGFGYGPGADQLADGRGAQTGGSPGHHGDGLCNLHSTSKGIFTTDLTDLTD